MAPGGQQEADEREQAQGRETGAEAPSALIVAGAVPGGPTPPPRVAVKLSPDPPGPTEPAADGALAVLEAPCGISCWAFSE